MSIVILCSPGICKVLWSVCTTKACSFQPVPFSCRTSLMARTLQSLHHNSFLWENNSKRKKTQSCILLLFLTFSFRGFNPLLWWQHVHEGCDADHHAYWSWGCVFAVSLPAGLRSPHGHYLPRLSRHATAGVGRESRQTHGQSRYRMPHPAICHYTSTFTVRWFTVER